MLIKIVYLILIFFGVKYLLNILTKQTNGSDNNYQKSSSNKTYKNNNNEWLQPDEITFKNNKIIDLRIYNYVISTNE